MGWSNAGWVGRRAALVPLALVIAMLLGACGSGEDSVPSNPRLSKPQLLKQLDLVCQGHTEYQVEAVERFDKKHGIPYGNDHEKATDSQLEEELVKAIMPIVRDTIHDVKQLNPNVQQQPTLEAFIEALEFGVKRSVEDPSWIATSKFEPFRQARALSWKLGTALCGQA